MKGRMYASDLNEMRRVLVEEIRKTGLERGEPRSDGKSSVLSAFEGYLASKGRALTMFFGILDIPEAKLERLIESFCAANAAYASAGPSLKAATAEFRKKAEERFAERKKEEWEQARADSKLALALARKPEGNPAANSPGGPSAAFRSNPPINAWRAQKK